MTRSDVLSIRVPVGQKERLARLGRRQGQMTPGRTAARLVEEGLRMAEYPYIVFRDSAAGRQASVLGTRLLVWHVVMVARVYDGDAAKTAEHLNWAREEIEVALAYAQAFPEEIESMLDLGGRGFDELKRLLPTLERFPPAAAHQ